MADTNIHFPSPAEANTRYCPWCGALAGEKDACFHCGGSLEDTRLGKVLGGRFRIDELLGQGGFGRVYKGTHLGLGARVAVKFLLAQWAQRPDLRQRFRREANALVKLAHPGIVTALDFGEDEGSLYLVMELVQGAPLHKLSIVDGQTMEPARIAQVMAQVVEVLEAAHAAGIVHRDLKPENILLVETPAGEKVKILDFGLALMQDEGSDQRLTQTDAVLGTPIYMAPEQASGRDITSAVDVYAAGIILYELLAGGPPFVGDAAATILAQHMFVDPPPVSERGLKLPATSPALEAVARKALAKDPKARPTARELREMLVEAAAGRDAVTQEAAARAKKIAGAALTRDERGLGHASPSQAVTSPGMPAATDKALALAWGLADARLDALRTALGMQNVRLVRWDGAAPPPASLDGDAVKTIVLAANAEATSRMASVRGAAATKRTPIMVVDVGAAEELPSLIRAGASDALLFVATDDQVCSKVLRLIQRGR